MLLARRGAVGGGRSWPRVAMAALLATSAFAAGVVLAAVGAATGPGVMLMVPVVATAVLVGFRYRALAPCLLLIAMPAGLQPIAGGVEVSQAVAALVVGLIVLGGLAARRAALRWSPPLAWAAAMLAIAALGTARAPNLGAAIRQDLDLVLGLLLVCSVLAACRSITDVRRIVAVAVGVGALVCAISLRSVSGLQAINGAQVVNNRLQGTFTEPNQFGSFSAVVLMLSFGLALAARTRGRRVAAGAAGLAALLALGLALSRGAWIGSALALALLCALLPSARRGLVAAGVLLLLGGALLGAFRPDSPEVQIVKERVATFSNPTDNPYDDRPSIWREGRRQVLDSPWIGQGPGQFPTVSDRAASAAQRVQAQHAHDVLLTVAAELGLPAAVLLIGFTLSILAALRRTMTRLTDVRDRALVAGVGAALSIIVGQGLVDFELRNSVIFLLLAVLLGCLLAADRISAGAVASDDRAR
jgi:O-antigen ligase